MDTSTKIASYPCQNTFGNMSNNEDINAYSLNESGVFGKTKLIPLHALDFSRNHIPSGKIWIPTELWCFGMGNLASINNIHVGPRI